MRLICGSCRTENAGDQEFCVSCGASLVLDHRVTQDIKLIRTATHATLWDVIYEDEPVRCGNCDADLGLDGAVLRVCVNAVTRSLVRAPGASFDARKSMLSGNQSRLTYCCSGCGYELPLEIHEP